MLVTTTLLIREEKGTQLPSPCLLPCPQLGHTSSLNDYKGYVLHGLVNKSEDLNNKVLRYLYDLYELEPQDGFVAVDHTLPTAQGSVPSVRPCSLPISQERFWKS